MANEKQVTALVPTTIPETQDLAKRFAQSRLLPAELQGKEADVFVTILAGMELGLAPMASLRSIHIIKGKPVLSADGMVAVVQASGLCEYFIAIESSDKVATYETKRRGAPAPQRVSFSIEEAKLAGLAPGKPDSNWARFPAAMLRARAKAALARDAYPDAIAGVYTEDEIPVTTTPPPRTDRAWPPGVRQPAEQAAAEGEQEQVQDAEIVGEGEVETPLIDRVRHARSLDELGALTPLLKKAPAEDMPALRDAWRESQVRLVGQRKGGAA
jgi:RecT family